ncbi:MAG: hypothetical protein JU82_07325 [Sulfuricurvum sp. MLSB]|uniref:hypothetical protein n=1 Tax=unclassified Sulfuricurvum TaxID=2632390 RepID=UPI000500D954|nr:MULTISPECIES: hypothetical protein [unclassified Sulfuricurvum]KFN39386.1 MAG: hypothetical protein JU82_07325 [Sulfuricurvum sp. MLSB]
MKPFKYKYDSECNEHILVNEYGHKSYTIIFDYDSICPEKCKAESILGKTFTFNASDIEGYDMLLEKFPENCI